MKRHTSQYTLYNCKWLIFFSSAFSILAGGTVYILLRPLEPLFFNLFGITELEDWIGLLRENTIPAGRYFPEWFIFSLPNGLWAFAYSIVIFSIWKSSKSVLKYFWFASIPILVLGFESFQCLGIIHGTFSVQDVWAGIWGMTGGVIFGLLIIKLNNYEKDKG